ncbi:hypothetical protein [Cryptosporangium arvum]|uniref:Uncharacterized protein n=1 Tax=Cryptosporangium arvum DSM 44712 TaxID=927661 RepID=A0A010ZXP8_9ACTN|nr:hypothetical protein [Cryptosporangium arvum]EXG81997.1 hypothetical protein CryarDRAFT_3126 [Cryptosporangium arvum DSM 44712]
MTLPPLKDLVYQDCGYNVPPGFTEDFVRLHEGGWDIAERDWERIVVLVLDTDAVHPKSNGIQAIREAVEAAAAFLHDDYEWPWCPICQRGTDVERREEPA